MIEFLSFIIQPEISYLIGVFVGFAFGIWWEKSR